MSCANLSGSARFLMIAVVVVRSLLAADDSATVIADEQERGNTDQANGSERSVVRASLPMDREQLVVTPSSATFQIPIKHKGMWRWNVHGGERERREYQWTLRIDQRGSTYAFGFSLFSRKDDSVKVGTLQQLLQDGQSNVWQIRDSGGRVVRGAEVETRVTSSGLELRITQPSTVKQLFSTRPKTATAEIRVPGQQLEKYTVMIHYANSKE